MSKNMSRPDSIIRILAAVIIFIFIAAGSLSGTAAVILGIIAVVLAVTGFTGFCPLYKALRISTLKNSGGK